MKITSCLKKPEQFNNRNIKPVGAGVLEKQNNFK